MNKYKQSIFNRSDDEVFCRFHEGINRDLLDRSIRFNEGDESVKCPLNSFPAKQNALVNRLAKPPSVIIDSITDDKELGFQKLDMIHAAIGIAGEAIEFLVAVEKHDLDNQLEEAGDILFYMTQLERHLYPSEWIQIKNASNLNWQKIALEPWTFATHAGISNAMRIVQISGDILDLCKKIFIYGADISPHQIFSLQVHCREIRAMLYYWFGFGDDAIQHNLDKLNKRYPLGEYSDEHAAKRLDKQEA